MSYLKNPEYPYGAWVFIAVSFLLGFLDMVLLQDRIRDLFIGFDSLWSMITAFVIATVANFTAFQWGHTDGKDLTKKLINKRSMGPFLFWVALGVVYAAIRASYIIKHTAMGVAPILDGSDILGEILQIVVLAISYIGTGFLIAEQARRIFDADCVEYRRAKKEFNRLHGEVATENADLKADIKALGRFSDNFKTLERQYEEKRREIKKAERRTLARITGEMLKDNPDVTPSTANRIMEDIIAKNDEKAEKM